MSYCAVSVVKSNKLKPRSLNVPNINLPRGLTIRLPFSDIIIPLYKENNGNPLFASLAHINCLYFMKTGGGGGGETSVKCPWFQSFAVFWMLYASPASEFYMPTFRNTLSVPSSYADKYEGWLGLKMLEYLYGKRCGSCQTFSRINTPTFLKSSHSSYLSVYEDGTDRLFRNVGI